MWRHNRHDGVSTVNSDADQRKHQSSASLAFVRGIHRAPVNTPRKWPVTRKMFPFDDVIMSSIYNVYSDCKSPLNGSESIGNVAISQNELMVMGYYTICVSSYVLVYVRIYVLFPYISNFNCCHHLQMYVTLMMTYNMRIWFNIA